MRISCATIALAASLTARPTRSARSWLSCDSGSVSPGLVEIVLRPHPAISQQHGFGAVSAIADSAAGYAALSLMPAAGVLTTEFKINLLAPAAGERILARGRVVKAGRTLTLAQAEVFANTGGQEKLIALLTATLGCQRA